MASGKMSGSATIFLWTVITLLVVSEMTIVNVNARYLPTRGQDDRIERLRELLKDLLGNQYDYAAGGDGVESAGSSLLAPSAGRGHTVMFKRDIPASDHLVIHNTSQ